MTPESFQLHLVNGAMAFCVIPSPGPQKFLFEEFDSQFLPDKGITIQGAKQRSCTCHNACMMNRRNNPNPKLQKSRSVEAKSSEICLSSTQK